MTDHAAAPRPEPEDVIRHAIQPSLDPTRRVSVKDCDAANAALDVLLAERQQREKDEFDLLEAFEALERIAAPPPPLFDEGGKGLLPASLTPQHKPIYSDKLREIARAALAGVRYPSQDRETPASTGAGTPHARMQRFWDRMSLADHDELIAELTGWSMVRSDYAYEDAIADAFDKLAAAVRDPAPPPASERETLWKGFEAGWNRSGEGWNSEYPGTTDADLQEMFEESFPRPAPPQETTPE